MTSAVDSAETSRADGRQLRWRRLIYLALRRTARLVPGSLRGKAINLLVDSLPAEHAARARMAGAPPGSLVDAFGRALAKAPSEQAMEMARGALAAGLSEQSRLFLRWDLIARIEVPYSRAKVKLIAASPQELKVPALLTREPLVVRWIERYMAPAHVFYDVGAGVGLFSMVAARLLGPAVRVFAFEPAFMNFESLCRNVLANACEETVTPLPIALAETSTTRVFSYAALFAGGGLHSLGAEVGPGNTPSNARYRQPMLTMALDDIVSTFQLPMPNHLKISVNGTEGDVLRGAVRTLGDARLLSVLVDTWPERTPTDEVRRLLQAQGFRLAERHESSVGAAEAIPVVHLLYVREE